MKYTRINGVYYSLSLFKKGNEKPVHTCVISKKTAPRAVDRNYAKRRCRAVLREYKAALKGASVQVHIKPKALGASFQELNKDFARLAESL